MPEHSKFTGGGYAATPRLLATYRIKASQIARGTDILAMRPGLASLPHMEMVSGNGNGNGNEPGVNGARPAR